MLTRIDRLRPVYFVSEKLALDIAINLTYTSGVETKPAGNGAIQRIQDYVFHLF